MRPLVLSIVNHFISQFRSQSTNGSSINLQMFTPKTATSVERANVAAEPASEWYNWWLGFIPSHSASFQGSLHLPLQRYFLLPLGAIEAFAREASEPEASVSL